MDLRFSPEDEQYRHKLRSWLEANRPQETPPKNQDAEFAYRRVWQRKLYDGGWVGINWPKEYGGQGATLIQQAIYAQEITRARAPQPANGLGIGIVGPTLMHHGTEEQKKKFIPGLVSGETIGCFAITESDAGSDVAAMRTTATLNGDNYLLNGGKIWISNGPVTDGGLVYAYTDRAQKHRGMSAFFSDWSQPGLTRKSLDTMGAHCSPLGELTFDNFPIPVANRLGDEGDGFKICMWQLNQTRLNCAAGALGVARAAKEAALSYCNQRAQFGQRIGEFQMNQDSIAQMIAHEEGARLLVHRAAWLADQNKPNNLETSIGKYSAAEAANFAADAAMKILGAYGYSTEFPVERYYRDAKSYQIVEGSSNIQKIIIAQDALGYRKANR